MDEELRRRIRAVVKESVQDFVEGFTYSNTRHPLDRLIPRERKIRSLVGGLETSMGTKLWEPIAKQLAIANGFELVKGKLLRPEPMPPSLQKTLYQLVDSRESEKTWVNRAQVIEDLRNCVRALSSDHKKYVELVPPPAGSGVDIYLKKGEEFFAYDTKTVQPNVGDIKKFNRQIIEWYAYAIYGDPEIHFSGQIAYPYNPWPGDFWERSPHRNAALEAGVDALVEDEFWDFLSGSTGTYSQILEIFSELAAEGFGDRLSDTIAAK